MPTTKIKIFNKASLADLEADINFWLSGKQITIISANLTSIGVGTSVVFAYTLLYRTT